MFVPRALTVFMVVIVPLAAASGQDKPDKKKSASPALDFTVKNIDGQDVFLGDFQGQVLLMVNVASKCGYTPQYKTLEAVYRKYKDQGLKILAFPANNFGKQEPGTNKQIKKYCESKFDVTFDLFAKVSVKGDDQCPLYQFLTDKSKTGQFGGDIRWNFQKFLIDRAGQVVARFEPGDDPMGDKVVKAIEAALKEPSNHSPSGTQE